jgi:hypothetical protein
MAYERYARYRFDLEKIEGVLSTVFGTNIPKRVWDDIKRELLERKVIRKNCEVHLRILYLPNTDSKLILELDFNYDLASLLSKQQTVTVIHGLDEHIAERELNLPCFIKATVGAYGHTINASTGRNSSCLEVNGGRLSFPVTLEPVEIGESVRIAIKRREVSHCPGSYYLIMTELTESLRVYLDEVPNEIDVKVLIRPTEIEEKLTTEKFLFTVDTTLLPGHSIEFKLTRKLKDLEEA